MKRNMKIVIVLSVALVFAIAAGICIYGFLSPQRSTVYVFNGTYEAGTMLTADMLTPVQVDADIVVAGAKAPVGQRFVTSTDLPALLKMGDSLKTNVAEGAPLMLSLLSATGGNAIEMTMQSSAVAVTVNATPITGVTNDLEQGASVNVYVTYHTGSTSLLFEKMRVLAVHKEGSGGNLSGITLELTNEEAVKLINSSANGTLYFGLVNAGGYESAYENSDPNQNIDDALGQ